MKITILCVGKLAEAHWKDAFAEYEKRLSRYCNFRVIAVADEKTVENPSAGEKTRILRAEGDRLLDKIPDGALLCTLEIEGKQLSSEEFAQRIGEEGLRGRSEIVFVIGGSLGIDPRILEKSSWHLSFSKMTFPHQLMRVVLAEQIYRAYRILHHEPYHK